MYQICVSGAAKGASVEEGKALATELGTAIAKAGHALFTGATAGLPDYAAQAYKQAGGAMSLGISPAASKVEHVMKYHLPIKSYDAILYTGLHYVGRDALLITSADAVISVGGRLGTLHEFTIAIEAKVPIGFLQGAGGISDEVQELIRLAEPLTGDSLIVFNDSAPKLLKDLTDHLDVSHAKYHNLYQ